MKYVKKIVFSIIEYLIIDIPGGLGQKIRYIYYSKRFAKCGKNVRIDLGVLFQNPENIYVGNDVWFLPYSIITAKPFYENFEKRIIKEKKNNNFDKNIGSIYIGDQTAIGPYNILQGYGGIKIGSKVTTSARVNIYSFSHHPYSESDRSLATYANSMVQGPISCVISPIVIQDGAWLGISTSIFSGTIGENSFIKSFSYVNSNINSNIIAGGNPANEISKRFK